MPSVISLNTTTSTHLINDTLLNDKVVPANELRDFVKSASFGGLLSKAGNGSIPAAAMQPLPGNKIQTASLSGSKFPLGQIAKLTIAEQDIMGLSISNEKIKNDTITAGKLVNLTLSAAQIANSTITNNKLANLTITGAKIANSTIDLAKLDTTGTASNTTYLRGDGAWATVSQAPNVAAGTGISVSVNPNTNTATIAHPAHTGDVTGSTALTIVDGAVTGAKLANNIRVESLGVGVDASGVAGSISTSDDITSSTEMRTCIFNAGGATENIGRCTIRQGNATRAGFVEWFKNDGTTRMGYMGFNNDDLNIVCENSEVLLITAAAGLRCTGNITAFFSDARLKTFLGKIPNALHKINCLNGYYFQENDKAKTLGYNNQDIQIGVNAQEVEKVLPEIVTLAPVDTSTDENGKQVSKSGENIKTVYYEKLIPVLIEAMKELSKKVEDLENRLHK